LIPFFIASYEDSWLRVSENFFRDLRKLESDRGARTTVLYVKRARLHVTRYLTGHPLLSSDGVSITSNGFPKKFIYFKPFLDNPLGIRFVMTHLISLRHLTFQPKLDVKSIVEPFGGQIPELKYKLRNSIFKDLHVRWKRIRWEYPHLSTKKGPSGQAIYSAISDLLALPPQLKQDIYLVGGEPLEAYMQGLIDGPPGYNLPYAELWNKAFPVPHKSLRKLSYFSDKETKTRVIGILDYWSQTVLKPIHDHLMVILKRIKQDMTYNQDDFCTEFSHHKTYYSFDLTAATDRMPIDLQMKVLARIIGAKRAEAVKRIMVATGFDVPHSEPVYYNTGQPMGAYGSWPLMALTHHFIVQWASRLCGNTSKFTNYRLLGDDIVIADDQVASAYRELLNRLDMPISEQKTHVGDVYEFAKRWIYKGVEVTGFSVGGLLEVWKRYPLLYNFMENQKKHGWECSRTEQPGLIISLLKTLGKGQQAPRILKLYEVFEGLAKAKGDGEKMGVLVENLVTHFNPFPPSFDHEDRIEQTFNAIRMIKVVILQDDMDHFQEEKDDIQSFIDDVFNPVILESRPGLDPKQYRREQGITGYAPIIMALAELYNQGLSNIAAVFYPDPTIEELLECGNICRYNVSKSIFSARASHSRAFRLCRMVKLLLNELVEMNS